VKQALQSVVSTPARPERFLGLDVFGGGAGYQRYDYVPSEDPSNDDVYGKFGWDVGATVSVGVRWLGITGAFATGMVALDCLERSVGRRELFMFPRLAASVTLAIAVGTVIGGNPQSRR
jgi:hypothetical protein